MNFSKEVVLVTGSSRGIGKAVAYAFAEKGARVILNGAHDQLALRHTYESFISKGFTVTSFFGDLSDFEVAKNLFSHIYAEFLMYPTVVINNAGMSHVGLFTDTPPDLWSKLLTTNIHSAYHCSFLAVPHMISRQSGCIINMSSIWGKSGASCEVAYSTSKSALHGFTKSLAKELGPSNIRVNAIACGWIDTEMNRSFTQEERSAFLEDVPLCRMGTPEDVAQTCLYLASDQSSYMTGQVLTLDGGLL
ncbi:short-chain dehydrogenase [Sporanaerobium hydrogeniformans]|uniref:Short-chain dehydrogenase n=1 Tax=Sporanaerobium hydrogeniformans TaxID=3072179 RepID=A0AC61DDJ8_9FIRM|nr:3-oxoacyl-ACP reductase FabG [Sporanaerobium hydrogeniformans]PHV71289.1 short-chain dehydrogenase [Sporanaerobium hydrogeniformans]